MSATYVFFPKNRTEELKKKQLKVNFATNDSVVNKLHGLQTSHGGETQRAAAPQSTIKFHKIS